MSKHIKILLVEDEKNVGSTLHERLQKDGFHATLATTGTEARLEISHNNFDLVILDVGLPDDSGFEIAKTLRQKRPLTAIIFLTAFGSPEDRIRGLELGAEDYVTKPFHLKELFLRIKNALRRAKQLTQNTLDYKSTKIGRALIHLARFEIKTDKKILPLTHKECALLKLLITKKGKVVSRDEILNEVWGDNEFPTTRTVDNFIMRIRRMIEIDPEKPQIIRSVRGVGYQLYV
ncbi:MAG: response regulator transcription factor [Bdellovibrio sp.]|nr:response regulator transcription factor [Bdellovibrio sp.]